MITVVVINGTATAGKDTFIDLFTEVCNEKGLYPVQRFSSVDEVKRFATILGWDGVKDDKGRRFLSDLKDALTLYNDLPFNYMKSKIEYFRRLNKIDGDEYGFIFFHVREPKEVSRMAEEFKAVTLLIEREGLQESFSNHADKNVRDFPYDYVVRNNGTLSDLRENALKFFNYLTGGE